jgi:branched-chain amino acid transport system substrate-binding protein
MTMKFTKPVRKDGAPRVWSLKGYMAPYLLKDAIERAGTLETDPLITALEEANLMGVYGRMKFNPKNHQIIPASDPQEGAVGTIFQWQDGKRVAIYPPKIATGELMLPSWMVEEWKIKAK